MYNRRRRYGRKPRTPKKDIRIEYPSRGATYCENKFGVYEYGVYESSSVLAGQESRRWLGTYNTQKEAQEAFPDATLNCGCGYQKPFLGHLVEDEGY